MARKKVQLALILNDSARNSTLRKRKKSLMKKARELATLCGIKVCVIVFEAGERQPDVWPSTQEAAETLALLRSMSEKDQSKKMMDQEGLLRQRLSKLAEQVGRTERENGELEAELLMYQCLAGRSLEDASAADIRGLSRMVDMKLNFVNDRLERVRGTVALQPQDPDTPVTEFDNGPTTVVLPQTLLPAYVEAQGSQHWTNVARERKPMEAAVEELQRQNWPTQKNQVAEAIWMNPQTHNHWHMRARAETPLEELRTQNFMLETTSAQYPHTMPDHWLAQVRGKAPMESAMKEPQCHYWFKERGYRMPAEEALERSHQQCLMRDVQLLDTTGFRGGNGGGGGGAHALADAVDAAVPEQVRGNAPHTRVADDGDEWEGLISRVRYAGVGSAMNASNKSIAFAPIDYSHHRHNLRFDPSSSFSVNR